MLKEFTLKNGLRVATYVLPQVKSIHLRIISKGGNLVETKEGNGVAHFMEHMLVQGTPSFPTAESFSEFIESLAGSFNAHTGKLEVGFDITLPCTCLKDAIRVASEVFFEPLFVREAIEKERQAIITEIEGRMDSHFYKINRFIADTIYKGKNFPAALEVGGNIEVVKNLTPEEMIDYWKRFFTPKNTYLVVIGNFDTPELQKYLNNYFDKYQSQQDFPGYPKLSNQDIPGSKVTTRHDSNLRTNYLDIMIPSINLDIDLKERLLQRLCLAILGQLRNSRLFKLLRYSRGLVYNIDSGASLLPGLGSVGISSEVSVDNLDEVLSLIAKELSAFVNNGPTEEELEFTKNFLINSWLMAFDHPGSIANWMENGLLWENKIRLPEEYCHLIQDTQISELTSFMFKNWDFSRMQIILQGPLEDSEENIKRYSKVFKALI